MLKLESSLHFDSLNNTSSQNGEKAQRYDDIHLISTIEYVYFLQPQKFWQRFREIPEWIDTEIQTRNATPAKLITELENSRKVPNKSALLGTSALSSVLAELRKVGLLTQ